MKAKDRYQFPLLLLLVTLTLSTGLNAYLLVSAPDPNEAPPELNPAAATADTTHTELLRVRRELARCQGTPLPDSLAAR